MLSLRGDGRAEKLVLTYDMDVVMRFERALAAQADRASVMRPCVTYVQWAQQLSFRFTDEQAGLEPDDAIRARMEAAITSPLIL